MELYKISKGLILGLGLSTIFLMNGCSSDESGGNTSPETITVQSAQFIDSAVQGINYECQPSGSIGLTDVEGYFNYVNNDRCTFKVGDTILGSAKPSGAVFTPLDLTTVEPNLTNILRFLQTLDTDTTDDIITLPAELNSVVDFGIDFNTTILSFLAANNLDGTVVVSPEDANRAFTEVITVAINSSMFVNKTYTFLNDDAENIMVSFLANGTALRVGYENGLSEEEAFSKTTWTVSNNQLILGATEVYARLNTESNSTLTIGETKVTFLVNETTKIEGETTTFQAYSVIDYTPFSEDLLNGKTVYLHFIEVDDNGSIIDYYSEITDDRNTETENRYIYNQGEFIGLETNTSFYSVSSRGEMALSTPDPEFTEYRTLFAVTDTAWYVRSEVVGGKIDIAYLELFFNKPSDYPY